MFAAPFFAPVPSRFANPVFGRSPSRSAPVDTREATAVPVVDLSVPDDDIPDLAQRVREVGEW